MRRFLQLLENHRHSSSFFIISRTRFRHYPHRYRHYPLYAGNPGPRRAKRARHGMPPKMGFTERTNIEQKCEKVKMSNRPDGRIGRILPYTSAPSGLRSAGGVTSTKPSWKEAPASATRPSPFSQLEAPFRAKYRHDRL